MKKSILISLCALSVSIWDTYGATLDRQFVRAIHLTETGGRQGAIVGDNGRALGPLQIHKACWQDAVSYGKFGGKYSDCTNLAYSEKVLSAYLNRWASKEIESKNFEALARCWNSGPNWKKKTNLTERYWQKVKKNLK
jgi:hypothetical protein